MLSCCGTLAKLATCPTAVGSPSLKVRKGERKEAKRVGSLEVWTLSPQQSNYSETLLNGHPSTADTHDIMDNSESPDCPSIHFNT